MNVKSSKKLRSDATADASKSSLELLLKDELQGLLDHFSAAFDIRIGVYDPLGNELICGLGRGSCPFCLWLRGEAGLANRCLSCDRENFAKAAQGTGLHVYRCHAGLLEALQPLRLDGGELAGFFMIGQFRVSGETLSPGCLRAVHGRPGALAAMKALFAKVPELSPARLPHALGLFSMLVAMALEKRMFAARGELLIARLEKAAASRPERGISLAEAAKIAGRSPSTISHLFKARLGVSFTRRMLDLRLAAAERLLREVPGLTVAEAASSCGFSSPFHFSRLFKKRRGFPPSEAKARSTCRG